MTKTIYTHTPTGQVFEYRLPKVLRYGGASISGITEANMAQFDIVKTIVEIPKPEPVEPALPELLVAKERAFALKLLEFEAAFMVDLAALPDINISTMLQAAQQAGATETEIANASAILMALFNDVVVESCGTSADAWAGLKSRLPGYLQGV